MKLNLGCGPFPIHEQHIEHMGDIDKWTLVDKFVQDPRIKNWDAIVLDEVKDNFVDEIYASHLLEHFPHVQTLDILKTWNSKLKPGGKLVINVPDLAWACQRLVRYDNGQPLDGYYYQFEGEHGLQSIFYGSQSHNGEYHKAGFTLESLSQLLLKSGFYNLEITKKVEAHDMGCLVARGYKDG